MMHPSLTNKQKQALKTVKNPEYIFKGKGGELLAVSATSKRGYLVVIYKEEGAVQFINTAYGTINKVCLFKVELIWNKLS